MIGREKLTSFVDTAFKLAEEDTSEDSVLGVVMLVMEVRDRETNTTAFLTFCTDKRQWVQEAALREAMQTMAFSEFDEEEVEDE